MICKGVIELFSPSLSLNYRCLCIVNLCKIKSNKDFSVRFFSVMYVFTLEDFFYRV